MPSANQKFMLPALSLLLGLAAAGLRLWQRLAAYDESGLPIPMAIPSVVLVVALLAAAALFLALSLRLPKTVEQQELRGDSVTALLLMVCAGLMLVSAVVGLMSFASGYQEAAAGAASAQLRSEAVRQFFLSSVLTLILSVAAVPTAVALAYRAKQIRAEQPPASGFAALMPAFYCWIWLIEAYRQHTANPIVWDYVFLLFAIIGQLISAYYRAGFFYGVGKPRPAVFVSLLAQLFTVVAITDCGEVLSILILILFLLYNLAELLTILPLVLAPPYQPRRLAREPADPAPSDHPDTQEEEAHE